VIVTPLVLDMPDDCAAATVLLTKHYSHGWRVAWVIPADRNHLTRLILQLDTPHRIGDGT
jgi:hypothetical protein